MTWVPSFMCRQLIMGALLICLPQLITSQASPPLMTCEQQVLAALNQQAAYNPSGYDLNLVWEPSFASSWDLLPCLTSVQSLTLTGAMPQLPSTWANTSGFPALQKLDLSNSQLTGTLPPEWGLPGGFPALLSLDLGDTGFVHSALACWCALQAS